MKTKTLKSYYVAVKKLAKARAIFLETPFMEKYSSGEMAKTMREAIISAMKKAGL